MDKHVSAAGDVGTAIVPVVPEPQKVTITLTDSNAKDGFTAVFAFEPHLPPAEKWEDAGVLESPAVNALFNLILPALKEEFQVILQRINNKEVEG